MEEVASCDNCQRELSNRLHDKCMYCGYPISDKHKLSGTEKEIILERKKLIADEDRKNHEKFMKKHKEDMHKHGGSGDGGGGDGGGGGDC